MTDTPPLVARALRPFRASWVALSWVALACALTAACGEDELEPLTEAQMCDEVRGLLSFEALGCTGDEAAAARFGDALAADFACPAELRPLLAGCLQRARGLGCGLLSPLTAEPAYLHWADACQQARDPSTLLATCATASIAFAHGATQYLSVSLPSDPDARAAAAAAVIAVSDALARHQRFWWPCAEGVSAPASALDGCVDAQRTFSPATPSASPSPAAAFIASLARSPEATACAALFPAPPLQRRWSDTGFVFDAVAVTLPLLDLDAQTPHAPGDALRAWFVSTYAPLSAQGGEAGAAFDEAAVACLLEVSQVLGRADAVASVDAFAAAFQATGCARGLLQVR